MSLQSKLDAMAENFARKAPKETLAIMHRATEELRCSGAVEKALVQGAQMPAFRLQGAKGEVVDSVALLRRGPLVLTFFRGHW